MVLHEDTSVVADLAVSQMMTRDVWTVTSGTPLRDVWRTMHDHKVRRLQVLDHNRRLVGLITKSLLINARRGAYVDLGAHTASTIMEEDVITAFPDEPAASVASQMLAHRIGCVPIISYGRPELVGIITPSDFIRAFIHAVGRAAQGPDSTLRL